MANDEAQLWGKWLRDRMTEAGINATELVARGQERFGKITVSQWLNGYSQPNAETALFVADILGVPESEALGASGHLRVAGAMSKLAATKGDGADVVDGPLREIVGFEHLPDELKARLIEDYRASMEVARERAREVVERWRKQQEDPDA